MCIDRCVLKRTSMEQSFISLGEVLCESMGARCHGKWRAATENGAHPPLAESGEVFSCCLWQWRIERVWSIRQVRLYHRKVVLSFCSHDQCWVSCWICKGLLSSRTPFESSVPYAASRLHTCQPSRSRRDSPDLETETRRPARRPKKSRFVPICPDQRPKHGFKPAFCLFSLFFSRNSSFFGVFWPFFMYPSVPGSYPNKKICIKGHSHGKLFILL